MVYKVSVNISNIDSFIIYGADNGRHRQTVDTSVLKITTLTTQSSGGWMQFLHQEAEFFMFPGVTTDNNLSPYIFHLLEWQTGDLLKLNLKLSKSSKLLFTS